MKIDEFLPVYHFSEKHQIELKTSPIIAYEALQQIDISASPLISVLFWLRGLKRSKFSDIKEFFTVLIDHPSQEIVLGLIACPWQLKGGVIKVSKAEFLGFKVPGYAKMVWNFDFKEAGAKTVVSTETRVLCTDSASYSKFRAYWFFVRPFSGLVRREMLRLLKSECEKPAK